jgi:predicted O-linked N-acetylglucosamine transferase (SPINDLY family)
MIQQAIQTAYEHQQSGRLAEAEAIYRQLLRQSPEQIDALVLLGIVCMLTTRPAEAIELITRAIQLRPDDERIHNSLGNALRSNGEREKALTEFDRAIRLKPDYAEAHLNRGNTLNEISRFDEAIVASNDAIRCRPDYAEAYNNLGIALTGKGRLDESIDAYRKAIALNPNLAEIHSNLGNVLRDKGRLDEAMDAYRQAMALNPNLPEVHFNLGIALSGRGRLDEAIAAYRRALELRPDYPEAFNNLGDALQQNGRVDDAIAAFRQAVALRPNDAEGHLNLGNALRDKGKLDEALVAIRKSLEISRTSIASNNLGMILKDAGRLDEAIASFQDAVAINPADMVAHSNLLLTMNYHGACDARAIAEELGRWNDRHAEALRKFIPSHGNDPNPDRRLRIGYVSADFWLHASANFLIPLLEHHDPKQVETFCYAQVTRPDAITRRFQQIAQWRSTVGLSDEQVAEQIRQDRIDILVDLKLHTAENRLLVFARKPAPVQATWLGYPGSTGLSTIDYRLTDPYLDPPEMDESIYRERTIRLPDTFWCYDPMEARDIPVNSLPAPEKGFVTFGCLNNFCKTSDGTFAAWAQVLRAVEKSRLLLLAPEGSPRRRALERFRQEGIDPARIEFVPRQSRRTYLRLYHQVDLSLDSFPCTGHTTSLDSFWMGVPVITLVGLRAVDRAGWSQLSNLGLPELAAQSTEEFVQLATALARDLPRLSQLRSTLRTRMERSPLMDAPKFARNVEAAYRRMWRARCADGSSSI